MIGVDVNVPGCESIPSWQKIVFWTHIKKIHLVLSVLLICSAYLKSLSCYIILSMNLAMRACFARPEVARYLLHYGPQFERFTVSRNPFPSPVCLSPFDVCISGTMVNNQCISYCFLLRYNPLAHMHSRALFFFRVLDPTQWPIDRLPSTPSVPHTHSSPLYNLIVHVAHMDGDLKAVALEFQKGGAPHVLEVLKWTWCLIPLSEFGCIPIKKKDPGLMNRLRLMYNINIDGSVCF